MKLKLSFWVLFSGGVSVGAVKSGVISEIGAL